MMPRNLGIKGTFTVMMVISPSLMAAMNWSAVLTSLVRICKSSLFIETQSNRARQEPNETNADVTSFEYPYSPSQSSADFLILLEAKPPLLETTIEQITQTWIQICSADQLPGTLPTPQVLVQKAINQARRCLEHRSSTPISLVMIPIENWSQSELLLTVAPDYYLLTIRAPELRPTEYQYLIQEIRESLPFGAIMVPPGRSVLVQLGGPSRHFSKFWRFAEHLRNFFEIEWRLRFASGSFEQLEQKLMTDTLLRFYQQSVVQLPEIPPPQLYKCLADLPISQLQTRADLLKAIAHCLHSKQAPASIPYAVYRKKLNEQWHEITRRAKPLSLNQPYIEAALVQNRDQKQFWLELLIFYDVRFDRRGRIHLQFAYSKQAKANLILNFAPAPLTPARSYTEILAHLPHQFELDFLVEKAQAAAKHWLHESQL